MITAIQSSTLSTATKLKEASDLLKDCRNQICFSDIDAEKILSRLAQDIDEMFAKLIPNVKRTDNSNEDIR